MSNPDNAADTRQIGKIMLIWALIFGAATWLASKYLENQHNPNTGVLKAGLGAGEPLVLERSRDGMFRASGSINGEPVVFLVDTGATYVSVSAALAERLNLDRTATVWLETANGRVRGSLTSFDEVSLGGYTARNVRGAVSPGMGIDEVLLGMSFLNRFDIQFRDARMILSPAGKAGTPTP